MADNEGRKDEFINYMHNSQAASIQAHADVGIGVSPVDAKGIGQTNETEEQALARLTQRYEEAMASIGNIDRKAMEGLPAASRSPAAMAQAVAEVEKKRDQMEADRNMQVAGKFVDGLLMGSMAGAVGSSAADKGMLSAGAGVFSPEEQAKKKDLLVAGNGVFSPEELEKQRDPQNQKFELALAKSGASRDEFKRDGVTTDGKNVDMGDPLVVDKSLPNKAAELAQAKGKSDGFERSLRA